MKPYRWLALAPILLACDSSPLTGRGSPADVVDAVSRDDAPSDDTLVDDLAAPSDAVEATDAGGDLEDDATDTFEKTDVSTDTFEKTDISTDTVENTETPTDTEAPADTDTDTEADTEAPADTEADVISNLCNPPLEVLPALSYVHPRELVTFDVNGGTGSPRFELVSSSSGLGADVHPFLGVYIAGSSPDTVDRVRVTDRLCEGEAIAEIRVVAPLAVSPSTATIAPLQHILLEVRGGSGALSFELVQNESGASVDANGYYLAGPLPGFDRVRITDIETHATRTLSVSVDPDGQLALVPPRIALPVGARWKLGTANGSGAFDVVANGTSATITDGWVDALAPGETSFTVTDRHTGESLEGQIDVISQLGFERYRAGDGSLTGVALGPGDIDGDDLPDAIIAFTEADVGHLNAGALYIYRGTDTPAGPSLDPTPVRILSGDNRNDNLGRAAAVADLDKDGLPELLVGVPFADPSGTNVGLVRIYPGVEGAFFGEESTRTFVGEDPGDTFGTSLAVCDFNGDSYPDLAIGAPLAEDSTLAGTTDSGGVLIWLGSPDGFATLPDQRLYGEKPAGDIWLVAAGARLGQAMAAGDMDGDGLCDLAVGATDLATTADRTSDGAVWIFRGRGPDAFSAGGVESHARLAWAGTDPSVNTTRLGYTLAMGDLDGDGLADLAMSQHAQKVSNFTNHGVVRVVFGGPFPEAPYPPTWLSPDSVDWTWSGGNGAGGASSDFLGFTLAIGDWDGTPPLDLFVGGLDDELTGTPAAGGVIFVLPGVEGGPPSTTYTRAIAGSSAGMRLGALLAPIGDLDGDGKSELVARAPNDSRVASRLGSHQLIPSTNAPHLELDADQSSAGARIGQSVAVLPDLDGDGDPELTVGAPSAQASTPLTLFRGGVFSLHRGTASGFDPTPAQRFENTTALSSLEGLGDAMVGLPDFDGDGRPDLAVIVARDGTTTAPCGTPTARSGVGSVHVFRGQADGTLATTPSYIYWGEQPSQRIERLTTADVDGDGKSDLLIGSTLYDGPQTTLTHVDAMLFVRGQALPAQQVVDCSADRIFLGPAANDNFGSALAPLGDLDRDGCEDIAVAARAEDHTTQTNTGVIRIVFGYGTGCTSNAPRVLTFSSFATSALAGTSLGAGDIDGDGLTDLAIGATGFTIGGSAIGATWVLTGQRILSLLPRATPWADLTRPVIDDIHRFSSDDSGLDIRVEGRLAGELFGQTVLIASARESSFGALIVSSPASDFGGIPRAGAILVYPWTEAGLASRPALALGGETLMPSTELGTSLALYEPSSLYARPLLVVGAPVSRLLGLDEGAVLQFANFPTDWSFAGAP